MSECLSYVRSQEGRGFILNTTMAGQDSDDQIIEMFRSNIDEEYVEFDEHCRGLLEELEKESKQEKFTFAELDENEEELQKLTSWFRKIKARDFFGGHKSADVSAALEKCRQRLQQFEKAVYKNEGLEAPDHE